MSHVCLQHGSKVSRGRARGKVWKQQVWIIRKEMPRVQGQQCVRDRRGLCKPEAKAECARQLEDKFVQNCSPGKGRGWAEAGSVQSVQEAGEGQLCVLGSGEGGGWRGLERVGRLLEGQQVVKSEGTPSPVAWGTAPHPVRLRIDPLWLCLSPPPRINSPLLSSPPMSFLPSPHRLDAHHTVLCQLPPPVKCMCPACVSVHLVTSGLGDRAGCSFS